MSGLWPYDTGEYAYTDRNLVGNGVAGLYGLEHVYLHHIRKS